MTLWEAFKCNGAIIVVVEDCQLIISIRVSLFPSPSVRCTTTQNSIPIPLQLSYLHRPQRYALLRPHRVRSLCYSLGTAMQGHRPTKWNNTAYPRAGGSHLTGVIGLPFADCCLSNQEMWFQHPLLKAARKMSHTCIIFTFSNPEYSKKKAPRCSVVSCESQQPLLFLVLTKSQMKRLLQ